MRDTIDPQDVERFNALAQSWWDPHGNFRPLHVLNPLRLTYIRDRVCAHFGRDPKDLKPLAGLTLLDIGCGGGLLCEPMARLGARVTGLDAGKKNIMAARRHADQSGLTIDYRVGSVEDLADEMRKGKTGKSEKDKYDIILNMEVVEHVADRPLFLREAAALLKSGGASVISTLNRTAKAYMLAIVGAEYVLGWLPRGTHEWDKFVKPSELATELTAGGLTLDHMTGVTYSPLSRDWRLSSDVDVNYMVFASRP